MKSEEVTESGFVLTCVFDVRLPICD